MNQIADAYEQDGLQRRSAAHVTTASALDGLGDQIVAAPADSILHTGRRASSDHGMAVACGSLVAWKPKLSNALV